MDDTVLDAALEPEAAAGTAGAGRTAGVAAGPPAGVAGRAAAGASGSAAAGTPAGGEAAPGSASHPARRLAGRWRAARRRPGQWPGWTVRTAQPARVRPGHPARQRRGTHPGARAARDTPRRAPRAARAHRHQERVRPGQVRRLHGPPRRPADQRLPRACRHARRRLDHDNRGARRGGGAPPAPGRLHRPRRSPVRPLHAGADPLCSRAPGGGAGRLRRRDPGVDKRQPLPLRRLPEHRRGHAQGRVIALRTRADASSGPARTRPAGASGRPARLPAGRATLCNAPHCAAREAGQEELR